MATQTFSKPIAPGRRNSKLRKLKKKNVPLAPSTILTESNQTNNGKPLNSNFQIRPKQKKKIYSSTPAPSISNHKLSKFRHGPPPKKSLPKIKAKNPSMGALPKIPSHYFNQNGHSLQNNKNHQKHTNNTKMTHSHNNMHNIQHLPSAAPPILHSKSNDSHKRKKRSKTDSRSPSASPSLSHEKKDHALPPITGLPKSPSIDSNSQSATPLEMSFTSPTNEDHPVPSNPNQQGSNQIFFSSQPPNNPQMKKCPSAGDVNKGQQNGASNNNKQPKQNQNIKREHVKKQKSFNQMNHFMHGPPKRAPPKRELKAKVNPITRPQSTPASIQQQLQQPSQPQPQPPSASSQQLQKQSNNDQMHSIPMMMAMQDTNSVLSSSCDEMDDDPNQVTIIVNNSNRNNQNNHNGFVSNQHNNYVLEQQQQNDIFIPPAPPSPKTRNNFNDPSSPITLNSDISRHEGQTESTQSNDDGGNDNNKLNEMPQSVVSDEFNKLNRDPFGPSNSSNLQHNIPIIVSPSNGSASSNVPLPSHTADLDFNEDDENDKKQPPSLAHMTSDDDTDSLQKLKTPSLRTMKQVIEKVETFSSQKRYEKTSISSSHHAPQIPQDNSIFDNTQQFVDNGNNIFGPTTAGDDAYYHDIEDDYKNEFDANNGSSLSGHAPSSIQSPSQQSQTQLHGKKNKKQRRKLHKKKSPSKVIEKHDMNYENAEMEIDGLTDEIDKLELMLKQKKERLANLEKEKLEYTIENIKPISLLKKLNEFVENANGEELDLIQAVLSQKIE